MSEAKEPTRSQQNSYQVSLDGRSVELNVHLDNKQLIALLILLIQKVSFLEAVLSQLALKEGLSKDDLDKILEESLRHSSQIVSDILDKVKS